MAEPEYLVKVSGCDATTRVVFELNDAEVATARLIAEVVTKASEYGCEPVMAVIPIADVTDKDDREWLEESEIIRD